MQLADRLILDAPRRTKDGYLAVRAKAARSGIYDYSGREVDPDNAHGLRDKAMVKVYRSGDQVFDRASIHSFVGKPITNDHPREGVNAANWRDHARGTIMGAVRDGEHIAFDLLLTDAAAIKAVEDGKRELSNGYSCQLDFKPGTAPDGQAFDAAQVGIAGNHIAIVDQGRAGPDCRIVTDAFAACDANPAAVAALTHKGTPAMAGQIIVDGLPVSLADETAVRAVLDKKDKALADATADLRDVNGKLATEQGKVTALEKQVADLKSELDPARIDRRVADRANLIAIAKAVQPNLVTDGKTDADIRKAVVAAHLGDKAPADDAGIAGAFLVITKDAKPDTKPAATVHNIGAPLSLGDGNAAVRDLARRSQY